MCAHGTCMAERNVQTVVPERLYESLARRATRERKPLKAVVREALEAYLGGRGRGARDPLLDFVGHGRLRAGSWSTRKDWRG